MVFIGCLTDKAGIRKSGDQAVAIRITGYQEGLGIYYFHV
jgi:hypothetical protein